MARGTCLPRYRLVGIVVLVLVAAACVSAAQPSTPITGIYTNMMFNREGGDVLGIEVFVVPSPSGYSVIFQSSEGAPAEPVVVPAKIDGNKITFTLPADASYSGTFSGTINSTEISGMFAGGQLGPRGEKVIRLRRGNSYWQQ